ncbi:NAD kinase [Mucilaginibacter arboris]|uniref:NAD kinase n=1 Tax=Mucilaginibacter arboris TaxID=2682090 RepID=A0A7K1SUA8_9SPHI|nr:NAD kinase [Mucilaginibacter arboris]MVN20922.1 NAD kinase [Mucilaginibacter arboris]
MKIAVYGKPFNQSVLPFIRQVFDCLILHQTEIFVHTELNSFICNQPGFSDNHVLFNSYEDIKGRVDVMLTLGGDGTILGTVDIIRDSGIPVIGINFGRLGFLASVNKNDITAAIHALINKQFTLDSRILLQIESAPVVFRNQNIALNDITIHKRDNAAMITVHAFLNDEFLNSYWGDGIIVSTPTGSTAYSLSCGGPIVFPQSGNFVITPISPHNLNVRPIIVSDDRKLTFKVETRNTNYLVSCDSKTETIDSSSVFTIQKAGYHLNLIRLNNESYLSTLRNKLMWGLDARNY